MFLAGQVSITAEGGNFWGEVWHVKWEVEPDEKWWTLHRFNFARRDRQAVFYGGRTTEQKASESNLQKLSDKWLDKYRYCRERYPKKANCKGYYDYMASKMSDSWFPALETDEEAVSEYGSESQSNTSTSLSSSVRDFSFEKGGRYHKYKEGRYLLPNDSLEQEREDMKHILVLCFCDGALHGAPLESPQKILYVGTGTGIWAIDMGDEHPESEITGVDLSLIQHPFVPPNVHFLVDDVEAEWTWSDDTFDYIHFRHMALALKDWDRLLYQAWP
ncbi:Secondary metabolism regulator LAE1 [Colletotrichum orbiculare MAFF 240422]|uniref:Secondary metabolism regulator LAE1 n=1 Tax=Colletotrichum orbiculare (strain 104-T / ATCC 96160 / CBS 514.97 / LARS 414 / MAFF 240422) TaxID=1213857 RepID=A0A484F9H2_COLOR|nr:Secondary metabolism regulator LAE1 [Colletotrichum orbiculare MAFF 240422]